MGDMVCLHEVRAPSVIRTKAGVAAKEANWGMHELKCVQQRFFTPCTFLGKLYRSK